MTVNKCFSFFAVHFTLLLHVHIRFFILGYYFIFPYQLKLQLVLHIHIVETLEKEKKKRNWSKFMVNWNLASSLRQASKALNPICLIKQFRDWSELREWIQTNPNAECLWPETGMTVHLSAQWLKAYNVENAEVALFFTSYTRGSIGITKTTVI